MAEGRISGADRGPAIRFHLDGEAFSAHAGETVAMALFAAGQPLVRRSAKLGAPRGVFCNMGICYDCLVYHNGVALRACMLLVTPEMKLSTWAPEEVSE